MSLKLAIYAIIGEQAALLALFSPNPPYIQFLIFIAGHGLSSILCSSFITMLMPRRYISNRGWLIAFFFSICFFVPVFGMAGMVVSMVYYRFTRDKANRVEFHNVTVPPFMEEGGRIAAGMGEGGAWSRLRNETIPQSLRLKALLAVGSGGGRTVNRLLRLATGDTDDEIRLLAFNLFDRQERVISQSITKCLEELKTATVPSKRAELCRSLALSNWEMVYNGLAQAELQEFFIKQSLTYALEASSLGGSDPVILVLIGRIHLMRHQIEKAEEAIKEAMALGATTTKVLPYLAEIAFIRRDIPLLKQYLEMDPLLRHKPGIGPVAQFWNGAWR